MKLFRTITVLAIALSVMGTASADSKKSKKSKKQKNSGVPAQIRALDREITQIRSSIDELVLLPGPAGEQGPTGPQGDIGPQGLAGNDGP